MKQKTDNKREASNDKKKKETSRDYETMSQSQNRHGKGRERNGSDGGSSKARGSNH